MKGQSSCILDGFLRQLGARYILAMLILTRFFGSVGGLLVIYYVELALEMPSDVRTNFRLASLVVVIFAVAGTVLVGMWGTSRVRRVLSKIKSGEPIDRDLGTAAGLQAVTFATRQLPQSTNMKRCAGFAKPPPVNPARSPGMSTRPFLPPIVPFIDRSTNTWNRWPASVWYGAALFLCGN